MAGVFELDLGETRDNPEDISEEDELEITDEHIEVKVAILVAVSGDRATWIETVNHSLVTKF